MSLILPSILTTVNLVSRALHIGTLLNTCIAGGGGWFGHAHCEWRLYNAVESSCFAPVELTVIPLPTIIPHALLCTHDDIDVVLLILVSRWTLNFIR